MHRSEQWNITPSQVAWLIAMTILGDGIFFLPTVSTIAAKQDAWLSFTIATVIGPGFVWLIITLGRRFPNQTIIEYSRSIAGSLFGSLIGFFFMTYFFLTTSYMTREFGEFMATTVMPKTPITVFMIALMLLCVYALRGGVEMLGRLGQLLFPLYILFFIITISLSSPHLSLNNLAPVLENPASSIVKGIIPPVTWIAEVSAMLVILPYVNNKTKAFKWSIIGVLIGGGVLTLVEVWLLGVLGASYVSRSQYPFFTLNREIVGRLDAIAMIFWIMGHFIRTSVFFFVAAISLSQWLNLRDYRPLLTSMAVIIVALGVLQFDNITHIHTYAGREYPFYALSIKIGIPLLLLVWSSIARKGTSGSPP